MAGGAKLATGWLELTVSTAGAQKSIVADITGAGQKAGRGFQLGLAGVAGGIAGIVGSVASKAFDAVSASLSGAISRVDTLNAFPKIMANLGYSSDDARRSIRSLSDGIQGLPTSLDGIAGAVQMIAPVAGSLDNATNIALAFNDALVAGGQSAAVQSNAMEQYSQMLSVGKVDMQAWRSIAVAMPGQLNQVAQAMLGPTANSTDLYQALQAGTVSFTDFNNAMVNLDKNGANGFASFAQQARDATGGIGTSIANAKTAVVRGLANVIQQFAPMIASGIGFATQGINAVFGGLVSGAEKVVPILQGLFGFFASGDSTRDLASALGLKDTSGVIQALLAIREGVQSAFGTILQFASQIGTAVGPALAGLAPAFSSLLPQVIGLWQSLSPVSLVFKALAPVLPQIASLLGQLATTVGGVLSGSLSQILPVAARLAATLVGVLGQAVSALLPVIQAIIPIVGQIVQALGGALGSVITAIIPIVTMFAQLLSQLVPIVMPIITAVLSLVAPILQLITPLLQLIGPILQPLIALFTAILQPILALVPPLVQLLVPALQLVVGVLTTVISWVTTAIEWFVKWITGNQEAGDQFQAVWSSVMGFFAGIGQFFANVWNGLIGGISNMISSVVNFFTSLPGQIGAVFAGAGQWLWDAGVNIVNGLIDGIKSMAGSIGKWFLSIIPDWIKAPFMAALGIHSPSRVFKQYGVYTMQGFIDGVTSMEGRVQSAADAAGQLNPPSSARAGVGAGQGGSSVRVSAPINIRMYDRDPRIVGAQIGRSLEGALHG